ncbi:hypothetical protein ACQ4WY_12985 [Janthinobacterium sp. LB2P49]|uniref:hypothetical protein n=1 Tax=Janthinobacterium sp. LB2P49 TaxID=3424198 RepID=UPI003F1FB9EC
MAYLLEMGCAPYVQRLSIYQATFQAPDNNPFESEKKPARKRVKSKARDVLKETALSYAVRRAGSVRWHT